MSAPARDNHAPDWALTTAARFAGALVNAVLQLKKAALAIGIDVVGDRRAAQSNRMVQDFAQGQPKALELRTRKAIDASSRANAGVEQAFIGVNVANPRKEGLIKQCCLDGQTPAMKERREFAVADCERIVTGRGEAWLATEIAKFEPTESARVDETQFAAAFKQKPRMRVWRDRAFRRCDQQPPRHAKMHDPLPVRGGVLYA